MAGEQFYYSNSNFAFRIDEDGRIIDNITNQAVGICTQKKNEILSDYNALSDENIELKKKLDTLLDLIEKHKDVLPDELKKLVEKAPTVESLQEEISGFKNLISELTGTVSLLVNQNQTLLNERGITNVNSVNNSGIVPKAGIKQRGAKGSGSETGVDGDQPQQPE